MKFRLTACACAALLTAACATSPAYEPPTPCTSPYGMALPDKPVFIGDDELFCYLRLPQERNGCLRHALANAAELELDEEDLTSPCYDRSIYTLTCKGALANTLHELSEVPQWLGLYLYRSADIDPGCIVTLTLRDAKGQLLWKGNPFNVSFQRSPGAAPVSLHQMLMPYLPRE